MSIVLKTNIEPALKKVISDKQKINNLNRFINKYEDKNQPVLYAIGPLFRLYFGDEERDYIYRITNIQPKIIKELIKQIDDINAAWKVVSEPFNLIMAGMIRTATIKKDEKLTNNLIMFLTLSLYSSLHYKYYRHLPNENAMNYTINNMSNKFLIKKYGVLYKALEHIALKCHDTYKSDLIRGEDLDFKDYIMNLRTRLNSFIMIITDEYLKCLKDKKYLNTEESSEDSENYKQTTNISLEIEKLVLKVTNKFFNNEIDIRSVNASAKFANCHPMTLQNALEDIKDNEKDNIIKLVRLILSIYLSNQANSFDSIKTNRFAPYCIQIYSKSNIKDKDVLDMKALLNFFLENYCDRYSTTDRDATKSAYRKALYVYMVLLINKTAVH